MMTLLSSVVSLSTMSVMDDTLTILSLESKKDGHKTQSQVTESTREVGSPQCARKESRSLIRVPVSVSRVNTPPSCTCRTQILTTVQTLRQRIAFSLRKKRIECRHDSLSHRPNSASHIKNSCTTVNFLKSHFAVAAAKLAAFLYTSVKPPTSLLPCSSSRFWCCPIHSKPIIFISCSIFGLGIGFVIKSAGFTLVPTFFVTNLFDLDASCIHRFCMSTCFAFAQSSAIDQAHRR